MRDLRSDKLITDLNADNHAIKELSSLSFNADGIFRPGTDSATALRLQNAAGTSTILNIDSLNDEVDIESLIMKGTLSGDGITPFREITKILLRDLGRGADERAQMWRDNSLVYIDKRGATVTFNPAPNLGGAEQLFNVRGDYVIWRNPSGTITVEVAFGKTFTSVLVFALLSRSAYYATDFTVEIYDSTNAAWVTVETISGNTDPVHFTYYNATGINVSEVRYTFTAYNNSSWFEIVQIGLFGIDEILNAPSLDKIGDTMYGDIDMNSNSLNNTLQIPFVNVASEPAAPTSGGILYVYGGALKYIGSSGTRTTIANA